MKMLRINTKRIRECDSRRKRKEKSRNSGYNFFLFSELGIEISISGWGKFHCCGLIFMLLVDVLCISSKQAAIRIPLGQAHRTLGADRKERLELLSGPT